MTYCKGCLSKQQKINELEEEITSLKGKLHYQERSAEEGSSRSGLRDKPLWGRLAVAGCLGLFGWLEPVFGYFL